VLLYRPADAETQASLIEASHPTAEEVRQVYDAVCSVGQIPVGSEPDGPLAVRLDAVLKTTGFSRTKVRTAVDLIDRQGAWSRLPRRAHFGLLRFTKSAREVRDYAESVDNEALATFVRTLLRTVHADAFREWWPVDLRAAARRTDLSRDRLRRGMRYLERQGLLRWKPPGRSLQVELSFPRASKLPVDDQAVQHARQRAETRLRYMMRYARSVACRRWTLLTYFGEETEEECGACDVCLGRHRPTAVTPKDEPILRQILDRVADSVPRDEWFDEPPAPPHRIEELVEWLVREGYLVVEDPLDRAARLTEKGDDWL